MGRSLAPANPSTAPSGSALGGDQRAPTWLRVLRIYPSGSTARTSIPLGLRNHLQLESPQRQGWGGTPRDLPLLRRAQLNPSAGHTSPEQMV